jgi:hypothetical protein
MNKIPIVMHDKINILAIKPFYSGMIVEEMNTERSSNRRSYFSNNVSF